MTRNVMHNLYALLLLLWRMHNLCCLVCSAHGIWQWLGVYMYMCVQWCCGLCVDIHVCPVVLWTMCRYTCVSSGAVDCVDIHVCPVVLWTRCRYTGVSSGAVDYV